MRRFVISSSALALLALVGGAAQAQVLVSGYQESSVRNYTPTGSSFSFLVPAGGAGGVIGPAGMAFGPDGFLYVSNQTSVFSPGAPDSIVKVNPTTGAVTPFISLASGYVPAGLAFGSDGFLYVSHNGGQSAAAGTGTVDRYNRTTGAFVNTAVPGLHQPTNLLFDTSGNLLISNFADGNIAKYNGTTTSTFVANGLGGLQGPAGMRIGSDGRLYVVDLLLGAVRTYNASTGASTGNFIADGGALSGQFPSDLLFDRSGQLLVADLGPSFTSATGGIKAFNATTGAFVSDFATGIFGASELALTPVPEPTSLVLCGIAAVGFAGAVRRRRQAAKS